MHTHVKGRNKKWHKLGLAKFRVFFFSIREGAQAKQLYSVYLNKVQDFYAKL